jgi:hypothetical protein
MLFFRDDGKGPEGMTEAGAIEFAKKPKPLKLLFAGARFVKPFLILAQARPQNRTVPVMQVGKVGGDRAEPTGAILATEFARVFKKVVHKPGPVPRLNHPQPRQPRITSKKRARCSAHRIRTLRRFFSHYLCDGEGKAAQQTQVPRISDGSSKIVRRAITA